MKRIVYISAPYSKGDVAQNVNRVIHIANKLMDMGYIPFVPHLTHFWHIITPRPYDDWMQIDLAYLGRCDALLRLSGASLGADKEVAVALRLGIMVYYNIEDIPDCKGAQYAQIGRNQNKL